MRGSAGNDGRRLGAVGVSLLCALTLAGCADAFVGMSLPSLPKIDDVNPFAEKPVPLPGKRVSVIQQENVTSNLAAADKPILLPPQRQNDCLEPARRRCQQRAGSPCVRRRRQERLERGRRHGLQLLRQAHGEPDRLRRQGVHARCRRQGVGVQHLGRSARRGGFR